MVCQTSRASSRLINYMKLSNILSHHIIRTYIDSDVVTELVGVSLDDVLSDYGDEDVDDQLFIHYVDSLCNNKIIYGGVPAIYIFEHCWVFDGHKYDIVKDKAVSYFIAILISVIAEGNKLSDLKVVDKLDKVVCNPEIPSWDYDPLSSLQGFANEKVQ